MQISKCKIGIEVIGQSVRVERIYKQHYKHEYRHSLMVIRTHTGTVAGIGALAVTVEVSVTGGGLELF